MGWKIDFSTKLYRSVLTGANNPIYEQNPKNSGIDPT